MLRAACSSRRASESEGAPSSSLLPFTICITRDLRSVVTLRTSFDTGVRTGKLLGELSTGLSIRVPERIEVADLGLRREQSTEQREQSTELMRIECRIANRVPAQGIGTLFAHWEVLVSCG